MTARMFAFTYRHPTLALAMLLLVSLFNDDSCGKGHWR